MPYGPHTADDRERMLATIGVDSVDALFDDIPEALRAAPLDLPAARARAPARRPAPGAGRARTGRTSRRSWAPASTATGRPPVVDQLLLRGEWYTAYTPYQPEVSQGTLQSIYEYQSLLADLTGLDVVSASHYDGGAATAEAALMTCRATRRERLLVSRASIPTTARRSRRTLGGGLSLDEIPLVADGAAAGTTDLEALARLLADGTPGRRRRRGAAQRPRAAGADAGDRGAGPRGRAPCSSPSSSRSPRRPRAAGRVRRRHRRGEGQPLGIPPQYGGPYLGIVACTDALVRQIPGRLVGMTKDLDGQAGVRDDACARGSRTSGARRPPPTSAPTRRCSRWRRRCTWRRSGPHGLRDVAATGAARAAELARALEAAGAPRLHPGAYLNEFAVRVPDARAVHARLLDRGILAGIPPADLLPDDPSLADGLLVCATEVTTSDEIARFASAPSRRRAVAETAAVPRDGAR